MNETTTEKTDGYTESLDDRSRAFVALALGLVGALGGGVVVHAIQSVAFLDVFSSLTAQDFLLVTLLQGVVVTALGAAAVVLGRAAAATADLVAAPAGRAASVLGVIAVAGGVVTAVVGIIERL